MNVFVIPSWYPSNDYPLNGIFTAEQTYKICELDPTINIGVSLWGQKDDQNLLWVNDHFKNLKKILNVNRSPSNRQLLPNLIEFTTPTLMWTRKIFYGNLQNVIKANLKNLEAYTQKFGSPNLIHAHVGYPAGRIAFEISTKLKIPYILTEHMIPFPSIYDADSKGNLTKYYYTAYKNAAANIAVGHSLANTMNSIGIPNVSVIHNFIDESLFLPANSPSNTNDDFVFFTLCEIIPRKGIDILLEAIKLMASKLTSEKVIFRIGGDGSHLEEYKVLAAKLKIEAYVEWLGFLTREAAALAHQEADAFVLPSRDESMGIVYIEALACGKPVIATKCGGPETIVNTLNGFLIEKDNPQALAHALLHMLNEASKYDSTIIRQDFMKRFSKKAVVPQIIDLYKEVIAQQ